MDIKNKVLSFLNKLIPKSEKMITIFGRTAINDNGFALLDYIGKYKDKDYKIRLVVSKDLSVPSRYFRPNVKMVTNPIIGIFTLLRSKWIFHTFGMHSSAMFPSGGQIIFSLWHGSPLKAICKLDPSSSWNFDPKVDTYYLSASPFWNDINIECWGYEEKQLFIGSNPRNDFLFNKCKLDLPFDDTKKFVLFMPTYRKSDKLKRNDSITDLPLITEKNIDELNSFLKTLDIVLVIKPHPAQNDIPYLQKSLSNILLLKNQDLDDMGVNLYELLGCSSALISDFSSVYFDYLLLDKPIGFAIDNIEDYSHNRGFTVDDPEAIMPGPKIKNLEQLKQFFKDLYLEKDEYKDERFKVRNLTNTYQDNSACKRITDFVGIS